MGTNKRWHDLCLHSLHSHRGKTRFNITRYTTVNRAVSPDCLHHLCTSTCTRTCAQIQKHIHTGTHKYFVFLPFASVNTQLVAGRMLLKRRCSLVVAPQQDDPGPLRVPDLYLLHVVIYSRGRSLDTRALRLQRSLALPVAGSV